MPTTFEPISHPVSAEPVASVLIQKRLHLFYLLSVPVLYLNCSRPFLFLVYCLHNSYLELLYRLHSSLCSFSHLLLLNR